MHGFASLSVAEKASIGPVECAEVNAHGQGGALLVTGTVPTLFEGAAGIEPTDEAEKATTAKLEILRCWHPGRKARLA
jgi:hypothetical protein